MNNHHEHANLIWQIADLLRGPYRPPQYERVMLPMTVLRRFDCVLALTKAKVLAEYARRKGGKLSDDALDRVLDNAAGQRFHNHSPLTFEKLKRLTIGAKVSARLIGTNNGQVSVEVSESNGVGVTITEYRLTAAVRHHNAKLITLFLWKVPETDSITHEGALPNKISLKDSSGRTAIPVSNDTDRLKSILMGSKEDFSITLMGYDELGRPVSTSVKIP
jgi:hypothetical protein